MKEAAQGAAQGAAGPRTYRTVKEGQEIMAVKMVRGSLSLEMLTS